MVLNKLVTGIILSCSIFTMGVYAEISKNEVNLNSTIRVVDGDKEIVKSRTIKKEDGKTVLDEEKSEGDLENVEAKIDIKVSDSKIYFNDLKVNLESNLYIQDGNTIAHSREILERMGYELEWDGIEKKVIAKNGKNKLELKIGSSKAYLNNKAIKLDIPPKLIDSKTYIQLRVILESLGAEVDWDGDSKTINIEYKK
jgi:hypothetical protein